MAEIVLGVIFVIFGLMTLALAFLAEMSHSMKPGHSPGDANDRKHAIILVGISLALFVLSGFLFFWG